MNNLERMQQMLAPPGNGIYSVSVEQPDKEKIQKLISGSFMNIDEYWKSGLSQLTSARNAILGIPTDTGNGILRGSNWGPLYLRHLLHQREINDQYIDLGDIRVIPQLLHDKYLSTDLINKCRNSLYGMENDLPVSPLSMTETVRHLLLQINPNIKVLAFGGDHSVSYPLIKSVAAQTSKIAVIQFDAHTDLLPERMGIDLTFGSWAHQIIDHIDLLVQLGISCSSKPKAHWEQNTKVRQIWIDTIKEKGAIAIAAQITQMLKLHNVQQIYISFDVDVLDASYVATTGTPNTNGMAPHQAVLIIQKLLENFKLVGSDIVEFAPHLNTMGPFGKGPETAFLSLGPVLNLLLTAPL